MTQEEAEKLAKEDPDKQPAMVVIQDFDKFFIRLKEKAFRTRNKRRANSCPTSLL